MILCSVFPASEDAAADLLHAFFLFVFSFFFTYDFSSEGGDFPSDTKIKGDLI